MNNQIIYSEINGEKIAAFTFFDHRTRNSEVTDWHRKVTSFFRIPCNYIEIDYRFINHGGAMETIIRSLLGQIDYFVFLDNDCIPLRGDILSIVYDKIRDKRSVFGGVQNSNHIHKNPTHPFICPSSFCISSKLYERLGFPHLGDSIQRSDTCEEVTWKCEEMGFNVCKIFPSSYLELTEKEMAESGNPKVWKLTNTLNYGLGTSYGDLFFHAGMQLLPRSKEVFIEKCKEVLCFESKIPTISAVITCVGYSDVLKISLPLNKKHFDEIIVVTDFSDKDTYDVCSLNNVKCIKSDSFYKNGAIFNKGAGINSAYKELKNRDWCVNLDADIILPDNFRHAFFAHDLDKNLLYGAPRKFIWNLDQWTSYLKDFCVNEDLLTLDGSGAGYFQAFNFKSDKLIGLNPNNIYPDSRTAEQVDIDFLYRFCPPPHPMVPRMNFDVIHLGPPGLFNSLKSNSKIKLGDKASFDSIPNLSRHSFFDDYPDICGHFKRKEQSYSKYYKYYKNSINHRDFVFRMVLSGFGRKPISILEIGTSRSLDGKAGDGWSTMFWAEYIKMNGGKLLVCDVDDVAISNSKTLVDDFIKDGIDIQFKKEDGINHINNEYDLIFLDGSDCPMAMLDQFEKIDRSRSVVLCDDFHVKGKLVREKYRDFKLIKVNSIHEMAIYFKKQ